MKSKLGNFFMTTLNGMAYGLFSTLIVGTILSTIGNFFPVDSDIYNLFKLLSTSIQSITGMGIGCGIALALKFDALKTIALASVGQIAAIFSKGFTENGIITIDKFKIGDPLTIYLVVIFCVILMSLVLKRKTPVDILIVPLFTITIGIIATLLIRTPTIYLTYGFQYVINHATTYQPFLMGIIISVLMGMALTAPISSAAIAAIVFTGSGEGLAIASGAAVVGCCTQMVGFAIQSIYDNKIGMVFSIGIGTSMLQFKNILKKPIIWLPTIIVSAILGPISTCLLKIKCLGSSAGMGTAGLVGNIGTLASMGSSVSTYLIIIFFEILLPIVLVFFVDLIFRKFNLIKKGDLKVEE